MAFLHQCRGPAGRRALWLKGLALIIVIGVSACGSDGDNEPNGADPELDNGIDIVDSSGGGEQGDECSVAALNRWVEDGMRDYYYYYDQVPVVNINDYASPEALILDLRVQPFDGFSYVTEKSTQQSLFEEGKSFGFGFRWKRDANNAVRLARVYPDSPMGRAGLQRGDIINSIGGTAWNSLTEAQFTALVGTADNPLAAVWNFTELATGESRNVTLTMAEFTIDTVLETQVITVPGYAGKIGYLLFTAFLETSAAELDAAFAEFKNEGIDELILDLRYNGGGRVSIARKLASLVGGTNTDGKLLMTYRFNDRYTASDFSYEFEPESQALGLSRLVVLTTGSTASSSELVMNSLAPYIDVVGIGSRSRGKPYITYARENCTKSMNALSAEGFNASDVSVYGGIAATCGAVDDPVHPFGLPAGVTNLDDIDQMLASGLRFVTEGSCEAPVAGLVVRTRGEQHIKDIGLDPVGAIEVSQ